MESSEVKCVEHKMKCNFVGISAWNVLLCMRVVFFVGFEKQFIRIYLLCIHGTFILDVGFNLFGIAFKVLCGLHLHVDQHRNEANAFCSSLPILKQAK